MKGQVGQLTEILKDAEDLALGALSELLDDFGQPLYVPDPGRGKFEWPEDPSQMGPEMYQSLVNVWGEQTVERYLMESAMRRMAEAAEES